VHLSKTVKFVFCAGCHDCYQAETHVASRGWYMAEVTELTVKFYDHLWCIKYESKQACKQWEEVIIDNYISPSLYAALILNKQLTCTCSKFLMMSVLVGIIRLKKTYVHQVSVNSQSWKKRLPPIDFDISYKTNVCS